MKALRTLVVAACVALAAAQAAAQVSLEPKPGKKGKPSDTFVLKVGPAAVGDLSFLRVADYPAQEMKKECQDPLFRGMQVRGAWHQATLVPAPGTVVAVYDRTVKLERMGFPAFPLASLQGPGWSVTAHWITTLDVRVLQDCQEGGRYDWWHIDPGGEVETRLGLLLDVSTEAGREWWFIEKCGDAPATARKLSGPGGPSDLECPPGK